MKKHMTKSDPLLSFSLNKAKKNLEEFFVDWLSTEWGFSKQ